MNETTVRAKPVTGYLHPRFASSLTEFGTPIRLQRSGGWLLVRQIEGSNLHDAMGGPRHLFCDEWGGLAEDIAELAARSDLVSLIAVPDPFAPVDEAFLAKVFPDVMRPYKTNYVIDVRDVRPSPHHRAKLRANRERVEVSVCTGAASLDLVHEWEDLYANLAHRHRVTGLNAFSPRALREQLATPGCVAFRAARDGIAVGMMLWYLMGEIAHYHLGASSPAGYEVSASYALVATAIEALGGEGARFLNLGSGAGTEENPADGLSRFKRGWASTTRPSYLCGRVLDATAYDRLTTAVGQAYTGHFFPAYRASDIA